MRPLLLFLILGIFPYWLNGQNGPIIIKGNVFDISTYRPLGGANVFVTDNQANGTFTNSNGFFRLVVEKLPVEVSISYLGYETVTVRVEKNEVLQIVLIPKAFELPGIEFSEKVEMEPLSEPFVSIVDFLLVEDRVLYYRVDGFKKDLVLADLDGAIIDEYELNKKGIREIEAFHQSCMGHVYLITQKGGYEFSLDKGVITYVNECDRIFFEKSIKPCEVEVDSHLIFKYTKFNGLQANFYTSSLSSLASEVFHRIADHTKLERYLGDMAYVNYLKEAGAGNGGIGSLDQQGGFGGARPLHRDSDAYFWERAFYTGHEIPVIAHESEVIIFNVLENKMEFFSPEGNLVKETSLRFHLNRNWDKAVFVDDVTGLVYTSFDVKKGKQIMEIDLETGKCKEPLYLECTFAKRLDIRDGVLYLLHGKSGTRNWVLNKVPLVVGEE